MKKQVLAAVMFFLFLPSIAAQVAPALAGSRLKTFEFSYVKSTRRENQKLFGKSYNSVSEKIEKRLRQELERRGLTQVEKLDGPCCRITLDLHKVYDREPENFSEGVGCHGDCLIVETAADITITDRNAAVLYQRAYAGTSLGVFDPGHMLDPLSFLKVRDLACRSLVKRIVDDEGLLTTLNTGARGLSPDSGSVVDNTYNNDFFRFGYLFPAGWQVRSKEAQKAAMERGHELIYGTSPNGSYDEAGEEHRAALKLASFLFAADEHSPDTATGSSVQIVAFDLATDISFKAAEKQLTSLLDSANLPGGHPLRGPAKFSFDGHQFATVQSEVEAGDNNGKPDTRYWAAALTLDQNYAIMWLFFSDSQSGVEDLLHGLMHVSFKQTAHD